MKNSHFLWILIPVLLKFLFVCGQQQRADGVGFIPRTPQNAKRIQERMSAIQRIKQNMMKMGMKYNGNGSGGSGTNAMSSSMMGSNKMTMSGMESNNMANNGMGSNKMANNGMGSNKMAMNGMGSNKMAMSGMGSNKMAMSGMGSNKMAMSGMGSNKMAMNGMGSSVMGSRSTVSNTQLRTNTKRQPDLTKMTAEQIEAYMDSGRGMMYGTNMMNIAGGTMMTADMLGDMIYVPPGMMGNNGGGGMMGNNGGAGFMDMNSGTGMFGSSGMMGGSGGTMRNGRSRGMNGQRRRNSMMIPLCQPLIECAERFIPPQCRSWRYDTVNSIMCRSCPINRCEGGAKEYFNTMYEYHPQRLMFNMLQ